MRGKMLTASLGLALVLQACTDDSPGLIVSHVVYWDNSCKYSEGSDTKVATGLYDVFCAQSYFVALLVNSFTMSLADPVRPRAEPSIIQFESAEVHLKDLEGRDIVQPFSTPVEGTLLPGSATDPGRGLVLVEAIPSFFAKDLNNDDYLDRKIIATFRLYGRTTGGTDVEVSEYTLPIQICHQCLTLIPSGQGCRLTEAEKQIYDQLSGCQGGHGYDGSYCVCDPDESGEECEPCSAI
jgi:hypothetical protein